MADITLSYKGATISEISASGTKTLKTGGKYCEDDITLQYVKAASYVKLAEAEFTVNQTSTTSTYVGTVAVSPSTDLWRSDKIIYVRVIDKAGKRNGHFLGGSYFYLNPIPANSGTGTSLTQSYAGNVSYYVDSNGNVNTINGVYGVFCQDIKNNGDVRIYARYNATYAPIVNGTYKVEVYALSFPDNVSPFA